MVHVEGEIVINRTAADVFDFVADQRNEPRFNPRLRRVEKMSPGPIGVGSTFRAETIMMRRVSQMTIEFTEYQRPHRLASSTQLSTMNINGVLTFEPVPGGTRMRWSWQLAPRGLFRLLTPVIARIGARQERSIWTGLKQLLEAESASSLPQPA